MFCSVFEMGNNKLHHRSRACGLVGSGGGIEQPHMCGGSQRLKITGTLYESSKLQVKAKQKRVVFSFGKDFWILCDPPSNPLTPKKLLARLTPQPLVE